MAIVISGVNNNDKITATDGVIDSISGFNLAGIITASSFTGDLTGDVTGNISGDNGVFGDFVNVGSNIQIGQAGILTATTFVGNLTGNVNATSNLLLQIGGSEKFRVASSGQLGIGGANYGTSGQVLTSGGSGSAATWSTISGTTINNNADNRVITGSGTANTLNGEANLTFDGTVLTTDQIRYASGGNKYHGHPRSVVIGYSGSNYANLGMGWVPTSTNDQYTSANSDYQSRLGLYDGLQIYGSGASVTSGQTVTWKNVADFKPSAIKLYTSGDSNSEKLRIDSSGNVTKPNQPSFTARSTGTWSHGSSTGYLDIDINMVEEFDVGGNYNGQIFTAPVAGKYFFSYTFQYKCTSGYLVVFLQKGVSGSYNSYGRMHVYPPQQSTVYSGPSIIGIIDLAAGNTVKPVAEVNYAGNQVANVNFSGYLLG